MPVALLPYSPTPPSNFQILHPSHVWFLPLPCFHPPNSASCLSAWKASTCPTTLTLRSLFPAPSLAKAEEGRGPSVVFPHCSRTKISENLLPVWGVLLCRRVSSLFVTQVPKPVPRRGWAGAGGSKNFHGMNVFMALVSHWDHQLSLTSWPHPFFPPSPPLHLVTLVLLMGSSTQGI